MDMIRGGVTAAKGFEAAGAETGVKYKDRKDLQPGSLQAGGSFYIQCGKSGPSALG